MSRPIDADALRERLQNIAYDDWNQGITTSFVDACNEIIKIVEEQPTIEPEIIHCKDCKYREHDERYGYMCSLDTGDPYELGRCAEDENWYCADAERREDDT